MQLLKKFNSSSLKSFLLVFNILSSTSTTTKNNLKSNKNLKVISYFHKNLFNSNDSSMFRKQIAIFFFFSQNVWQFLYQEKRKMHNIKFTTSPHVVNSAICTFINYCDKNAIKSSHIWRPRKIDCSCTIFVSWCDDNLISYAHSHAIIMLCFSQAISLIASD